jgi:carbonic anhydrase
VAGSKLVVVVGHTACGAIMGACDDVKLGNLTSTLAQLRPAVEAVTSVEGERSSKTPAFVAAVTHQNVVLTIEEIRAQSPILQEMEDTGEIDIVGATFDVKTGALTWL